MADGTGRSETLGPWLIKAGVPLAVAALAAFVYVRKNSSSSSSAQASDEDYHRVESTANDRTDEGWNNEVVLGLVDRIKELQMKEEELEARFERYQSMKECQGLVLELKNMLQLEMVRGDYLEKEVSSIEAEARRVQDLETYGLNLLQQIKDLEQENRRLKKKVKKFYMKSEEGIRVIGEQKLRIQETEAMIMRSRDQVKKGTDVLNKMAEEMSELQGAVDDLGREKMELVDRLELAEASLTLKHESEIITMEEYKHIINELQKLQKEFTAEMNELVNLRWTNACLRRQLMQRQEQEGIGRSDNDLGFVAAGSGAEHTLLELDLHHELDRMGMEHENSRPEDRDSMKRALMKKLKKWVEGSHHSEMIIKADKRDVKSFGRHYASDWVEEHVHGRKSFSSA